MCLSTVSAYPEADRRVPRPWLGSPVLRYAYSYIYRKKLIDPVGHLNFVGTNLGKSFVISKGHRRMRLLNQESEGWSPSLVFAREYAPWNRARELGFRFLRGQRWRKRCTVTRCQSPSRRFAAGYQQKQAPSASQRANQGAREHFPRHAIDRAVEPGRGFMQQQISGAEHLFDADAFEIWH